MLFCDMLNKLWGWSLGNHESCGVEENEKSIWMYALDNKYMTKYLELHIL